jgi:hypothetical protein
LRTDPHKDGNIFIELCCGKNKLSPLQYCICGIRFDLAGLFFSGKMVAELQLRIFTFEKLRKCRSQVADLKLRIAGK